MLDRYPINSASSIAQAIELITADITNPTELNAIGTAVEDLRLVHENVAGSDRATWYRLDTSSDAVVAPYIMASATAGLRWVAIAGYAVNQAMRLASTLSVGAGLTVSSNVSISGSASAVSLSVSSNVAIAGSLSAVGSIIAGASLTVNSNTSLAGALSVASTSTLTGVVTCTNTTSASSATTGALVVGNGTAATSTAIGNGKLNVGGTIAGGDDVTITKSVNGALTLTMLNTSNGNAAESRFSYPNDASNGLLMEMFSSAFSVAALQNVLVFGSQGASFAAMKIGPGNAAATATLVFRTNGTDRMTISGAGAITTVAGVTIAMSDTTDATSATTGSITTLGGASFGKNIVHAKGRGCGVTSTATAAGTTTLTSSSTEVQIFTGTTTQTVQLPAANLFGAGIGVCYEIKNLSTGLVTVQRAGSDTINTSSNVTSYTIASFSSSTIVSDGVSAWNVI